MSEIKHFTIKQMSENDRPREKLLSKGALALSESELLAIIIGSGHGDLTAIDIARMVLDSYANNLFELGNATYEELLRFKGIGDARAVNILAALELGRRRAIAEAINGVRLDDSRQAYEYLRHRMSDLRTEEFRVLFFNNSNKLIREEVVSSGGLTATVVDPRVVIRRALELNALSMIVAHNHPSGNKNPSEQDVMITERLKQACMLMNIRLSDHIIVTKYDYFSFLDNGKL